VLRPLLFLLVLLAALMAAEIRTAPGEYHPATVINLDDMERR
jgi:hypothetical protein